MTSVTPSLCCVLGQARGKKTNVYRVLIGKWKEKDHFEDIGIYVNIILKQILK
jgi:hypothetical protein